MGANVVWMRVTARLVVGHKHLWSILADDLHERFRRDLQRDQRETVRLQRLAVLGKAGILIAEPPVLESDDGLCTGHLDTAEARHVPLGHGTFLETLVQYVAAFATRAAHDHDLVAAVAIVGVGARALARLVVGMGVHGKQTQCHRTPWP